MKTKECPSCAMEIDKEATICPICKYEFSRPSPWIKWIAIFLVILFILFFIL